MFFTMLFKQAAQQSSRFRPEPEPSKIQVQAGTNRPELSSGAPLTVRAF